MPSFAEALGIHAEAVAFRSQRAELLATNLAHADTPGFRARDIDFKQVLGRYADARTMRTTDSRHLDGIHKPNGSYTTRYRQPAQASLDQNTVDVQMERAAFRDNAMRYQASVTFLNGKISGLMSVLRGE